MKLLFVLASCLLLCGCATTTTAQRIGPSQWWICDGGKDSSTCGANPEKGLNKTCFKEGKTIKAYRRVTGGGLIVTCQ